jgi:predicted dehydrogenase
MATEKIRVGIIGANVRNGWGRDAHIPALSALPEFEITAVCTSRQETADETAKHFGIPHAFVDPYKMASIPTWTLSRSACGCLLTISWG